MNPKDDPQSIPLVEKDPLLSPYAATIQRRLEKIEATARRLAEPSGGALADFASGHEFFGLHFQSGQWVFREWAPNATAVYLIGDGTGWREQPDHALGPGENPGVWEIRLPPEALFHGDLYRLRVKWQGGEGDRIPAWARRVVQDGTTHIFNAQVWRPPTPYVWRIPDFKRSPEPLLIYEVHVGMAQDAEKTGTYREFYENVIPRVAEAGYNALQLMAIQEHPYYASFGYHVSSFFAASSRFGTPDELKALIDRAHSCGLAVIMDLVHSHAVSNEVEGLGRFDGTRHQFFHAGQRGSHPAWDSLCFDYGKDAVVHFLLSNCRYWLDEYHLDGFRFDGITSMLYRDHGLGKTFTSYADYFDENVDEDALTYLALANRIIHQLHPGAVTLAEDVSGMPGLATPDSEGGIGFDYRFSMGIADYWIRLTQDTADENWPMGHLWHELTNRRADEKTISYAESHDQALVGDQTLIFRLIGSDMFDHMHGGDGNLKVDRGISLHKMIRLITLATAGHGYLNFMGNEFGHPEWIDFPREGNNWSYRYARRQWHLRDHPALKYRFLADFDREMISLAGKFAGSGHCRPRLLHEHGEHMVLAFAREDLVFVFNFNPTRSFPDYPVGCRPGKYRLILNSDAAKFGGHDRLAAGQNHLTLHDPSGENERDRLSLYLPTRTALVLERLPDIV